MTDPLDRVVAAFHALPVPERPPDAAVLAKLVPTTPRSPWRRVVKRTIPFVLAASVLAAGFLLVGGSSVALADVIKAAEKHKLVRYHRTQTTEDRRLGVPATGTVVCYDDLRAARHRGESGGLTLNEAVESSHYQVVDGDKDRALSVLTETVRPGQPTDATPAPVRDLLVHFPRREATLSRAFDFTGDQPVNRAEPFLARLRGLEADKTVTAAREVLDGTDTLCHRLAEGNRTTRLWVDAKTKLPVKLEVDIRDHTPDIARNTWVFTAFEWDPKLPEGVKSLDELFGVTPPAGYKLTDVTGK